MLRCHYLPKALFGRTDRPRIFHECTNSAVIRLFVVNSWTVFSRLEREVVLERDAPRPRGDGVWSERLFWSATLQSPGEMGFGARRSKAQVRWGLERDAPRPRGDGVWSETLQGPGEMGFGARRSRGQVMIGVGRFRAMFHQCMNEAVIGVFVARS